jgi:hypothetical protein
MREKQRERDIDIDGVIERRTGSEREIQRGREMERVLEQHIFILSKITEGATEKVLQFIMLIQSIYYKKTFGLMNNKVFLNTSVRLKIMNLFNNIF